VIRANALGNFGTMLAASAFHPAMLRYLNNADSTKDNPNENYARELMELHTVGVNGGYTETDVKHAALLLTGWQVQDGKASVLTKGRHGAAPLRGPVGRVDGSDMALSSSPHDTETLSVALGPRTRRAGVPRSAILASSP